MAASTSLFIHSHGPLALAANTSSLFSIFCRFSVLQRFGNSFTYSSFFTSSRPFESPIHSNLLCESFRRASYASYAPRHCLCLISSKTNFKWYALYTFGSFAAKSLESCQPMRSHSRRREKKKRKGKTTNRSETTRRNNMFAFSCALRNVASPATRTHSLFRFPKLFIVSFVSLQNVDTLQLRLRFILPPAVPRASDAADSMVVVLAVTYSHRGWRPISGSATAVVFSVSFCIRR